MPELTILHCFDTYLHSTMNWAYQLIKNTPDTVVHIAAPTIVRNEFTDPAFKFHYSPWQWDRDSDEWQVGIAQQMIARAGRSWYWSHVFQKIATQSPLLVHAHFATAGCAVMHQAKQAKLPLVVSFYGFDYEMLPLQKPAYRQAYRTLFDIAKAVLCEGAHSAAVLQNAGCPPEKVQILRLGIPVENIPFLRRTKIPGRLNLLQAATFVEKKGHIFTLQAFQKALHDCPGLTLTLVGEPHDPKVVQAVRRFITAQQLTDKVEILPFVDPDRFHTFLQQYDVFIHPSCRASNADTEGGAPVVLLQAQAVGLPVISTFHGDIPEVVLYGNTGVLCREKEVEELAAAIRFFYRMSPEAYASYSRQAHTHVIENYSVHRSGRNLRELYQQLSGV